MNFASIFAFLLRANTHAVGSVGIGTALGAVAVHIAAKAFDPSGSGHGLAQVALTTLDTYAATPALAAGSLASYFGRPATVPPVPPIEITNP